MDHRVALEFDPPDLAGWLWAAVGVLATVEGLRFVVTGRRPARRSIRVTIVLALALSVAFLKVGGWVKLDGSSHGWACLWLAAFGALWLTRSYRSTSLSPHSIDRGARIRLLALRLAAGGVVLLMLLSPVLRSVDVVRDRAVLGIALDDSRSMTIQDAHLAQNAGPQEMVSRATAVNQAIRSHQSALDRLGKQLELKWFRFDTDIHEIETPEVGAQGEATAWMDAVDRALIVLSRSELKVAGIVVFSDGRDNTSRRNDPRALGEALVASGVPFFAVGVGSEVPAGPTRSLQARHLGCPGQVAVLNLLQVRAQFVASGLAGTTIEAELLFDGEVVDRRSISPQELHELIRVEFSFSPQERGLHKVAVRARTQAKEGKQDEAVLSQFVRVEDDKVRVLFLDRARYERAAIARALESSRELRVTKVNLDTPAHRARSGLSKQTASLLDYHVVLLGDVNRSALSTTAMEAMRDLVISQGGGLAILGGLRTLPGDQFLNTALHEVVPVRLGGAGVLEGSVKFQLTSAGRLHPICALRVEGAPDTTLWDQMPPFAGANPLVQVSAAASVLIETPDGEPLLVVQEVGKGRAAVVGFDSTWQWSFTNERGIEAQRRFWRQLVMWLAQRKPDVWVTSDRLRYNLARHHSGKQQVLIQAGVIRSDSGGAPHNLTLTGSLVGPEGGKRTISWTRRAGEFQSRLSVEDAGDYRVLVEAKMGNEVLGSSKTAFVVESMDVEMIEPLANLEPLKYLANRTAAIGGEYVPVVQFGQLLQRIEKETPLSETVRTSRNSIVDANPWSWLAVFVTLVGTEWLLRRKYGLV